MFAMEWTDSHRSFTVETYLKTQKSLSFTLKIFRNKLHLKWKRPFPAHIVVVVVVAGGDPRCLPRGWPGLLRLQRRTMAQLNRKAAKNRKN